MKRNLPAEAMSRYHDISSTADDRERPSASLLALPTDIRVIIHGNALQLDRSVRKVTAYEHEEIAGVEVSLFTVCRQLYDEARDAFFDVNTIQVFEADPCRNEQGQKACRQLELAGSALLATCRRPDFCAFLAGIFEALPRLQSITVASDPLGEDKQTVRSFVEASDHLRGLRCIGHATHQVLPTIPLNSGRIFLKNLRLHRLLAKTRSLLAAHSKAELYSQVLEQSLEDASKHPELRFAWLLTTLEADKQVRDILVGCDWEDQALQKFFKGVDVPQGLLPYVHEWLGSDRRIEDVDVRRDGQRCVEFAGEVLAFNLSDEGSTKPCDAVHNNHDVLYD